MPEANFLDRLPNPGRSAVSILCRTILFALLWWSLAETRPLAEWPLVVVLVAASVLSSYLLIPVGGGRIRLMAVLRFLPYFLLESFRGGADVAYRSIHPAVPVNPGFVDYSCRLSNPNAQILMAWIVSLLPGTASVRLEKNRLKVHVLDRTLPMEERLRMLERRIASIFPDEDTREWPEEPPDRSGGESL